MSVVSSSMMSYLRTTYNRDNVANYCNELMQCPLRTSSTPTACCQSQGLCQDPKYDPAYYCKLNDDSGSSENYWIQTESKEKCDSESTALGCGNCKEDGISHTILDQAGMHDDLEKKNHKRFCLVLPRRSLRLENAEDAVYGFDKLPHDHKMGRLQGRLLR